LEKGGKKGTTRSSRKLGSRKGDATEYKPWVSKEEERRRNFVLSHLPLRSAWQHVRGEITGAALVELKTTKNSKGGKRDQLHAKRYTGHSRKKETGKRLGPEAVFAIAQKKKRGGGKESKTGSGGTEALIEFIRGRQRIQ